MYGKKLLLLTLVLALGNVVAAGEERKGIPGIRDRVREALTLGQASIRCDVKPKDAQVYLDGSLVGTVRDFNSSDKRLFIFPGQHALEFRHPDYETYTTELRVLPEQDLRVKTRMKKIKR